MLLKPKHLIILAAALSACFSAHAQLIDTQASNAVIMDYETEEILFSKNGEEAMTPASMTKIMTAHVIYEAIENGELTLETRLPVSERAWREGGWATGGSTMGLSIGETPTVEELLRGVIILSGNDACIVLAEGLSGTEEAFARRMTELAHQMGLDSAQFENASGLYAEGHVISAADLARLARMEIDKFPQYYKFYSEREMTWNGITQQNRNPLLGSLDGADGLKTGHLEISGYGLTASAERDGQRRILVINGLPSSQARADEAARLMRLAFTAFDTRTIEPGEKALAVLPVRNGEAREVGVKLAEPLSVTAHKSAFSQAEVAIVFDGPIKAPVQAGDRIATLEITVAGKKDPVEAPLIATENVEKLGFIGRAIEGLSLKIGNETAS